MRPNFETTDQGTLEWHAGRLKKTPEEVRVLWESYPDPKVVWHEFHKYLRQYHTRQKQQSMFTAPIAAGSNITGFDLPILYRYNKLYGDSDVLFAARDKIDLLDLFFQWFENDKDVTSYSMDNMRDFFGISKDNAHDALQDVKDSAQIIIRFMRLIRKTAAKVQFKDAFKKEIENV